MSEMASQITSITIVCSTIYSGADKRKYIISASLAFLWGIYRWPVNSPHKRPVTRKIFPFDDVIIHHISSKAVLVHWRQSFYLSAIYTTKAVLGSLARPLWKIAITHCVPGRLMFVLKQVIYLIGHLEIWTSFKMQYPNICYGIYFSRRCFVHLISSEWYRIPSMIRERLAQVIALGCQATNPFLGQCWLRSFSPDADSGQQWVG